MILCPRLAAPHLTPLTPLDAYFPTMEQAEIAQYEEEQGVEEKQRVAIIRDLHERAEAQHGANEAWARRVDEAQGVADGLAKKVGMLCRPVGEVEKMCL